MFADLRSLIGRVALTLGCICTLAATSVHAQDAQPDAGAPDAAPVVDAPPVEVAPVVEAPPAEAPVVDPPAVDAPVVETPLPEAPATNLEPGADLQTGIRGRIVDAKSGLGLEMAPVLIVGGDRTRSAITITNGAYELNVPPGVYTVRSFYDMHHGARLPNVRVTRGRFAEVNLLLDPVDEEEDVAVEEVEIAYRADTTTAAAQDAMRMESSGIGEGMGSQQMSQSGASDAGSAAKRVVGVTVEGTNLVIRGLGGRYSRVLMNGVPLPSTDPDSPSVDLDLFPTSVIDSMTVTKAFLPDMPADFAGGVLDIGTVTFPREFTFELGLSGQFASLATFRDRLDHEGGSIDALGFDDGTRALPDALPRTSLIPALYEDRGKAVASSFENNWSYRRRTALPNLGLDLTLGDSIDVGSGSRFGYLVAAAYDHAETRMTGSSRKFPGYNAVTGEVASGDQSTRYPFVEVGSEDVQVSSIATASLDVGTDHSLTALTLFNQSSSDDTGVRRGKDSEIDVGEDVEKWQLHYTARQVWFNQLFGDHRNLAGTRLRVRWDGFYALSSRDEPDRRNITYQTFGDSDVLSWSQGSAQRVFTDLSGKDGGGGASLRFPLWGEASGTIGGSARHTLREFTIRRFRYAPSNAPDELSFTQDPEGIFAPENLGTGGITVSEATRKQDGFVARQTVGAGYAMLETPIIGALSLTGGARLEIYKQGLETASPVLPQMGELEVERSSRTDINVLPGAALKYELSETMLLRAAYGLTVGRPQARELASFLYFDFVRDRNVEGNPDLRTTKIHNIDLRWEWFFEEGEILAASVFYKDFRDPIEQYLGDDGSSGRYGNTLGATAVGAELEARVGLKHIAPVLRNFQYGANLTLIDSSVELTRDQTRATAPGDRALYGQAPYVLNMSLRFADPDTGTSLGLVYNLVGPRLSDVGRRVSDVTIFPNVERLPVHSLDLVSDWKVSDHVKLKFKWKNMLLQSERWEQGGVVIVRKYPGTFVSVGLDFSY